MRNVNELQECNLQIMAFSHIGCALPCSFSFCWLCQPMGRRKIRLCKILQHEEPHMTLKLGQLAPDVALKSHLDQEIRLRDYRGKCNVVLAFFPLAWTPV